VDAGIHFCPECAPERRERAREVFDARGKTVEVFEGRYLIRAPHDYDLGEALRGMEKTIAELKRIGPLVVKIEASTETIAALVAQVPSTDQTKSPYRRSAEISYIPLVPVTDLAPKTFRAVFSDGSTKTIAL